MWNQETPPKPKNDGMRPPQAASPAAVSRPPEERRVVAWIGKSVVFKGNLMSAEDLTIDGRVEGTIELPDHGLTIGPNADIRADIFAKAVTVRGTVTGIITAGNKVVISETGSVEGDIISPRLAMADGAVVRGRVDTLTQGAEAIDPRRLVAVN